ncbi:unnamed protein product [Angiostrongylus costaricensis]|uniref:Peptidase_S15 domain-containing protein n=1 Tax=Angiostrongylus costaricensis TaxID=334426 RepID=A0A0R3PJX4_ANGCS|nr:unnamed protein product [Angiostrongylus costaricensis]
MARIINFFSFFPIPYVQFKFFFQEFPRNSRNSQDRLSINFAMIDNSLKTATMMTINDISLVTVLNEKPNSDDDITNRLLSHSVWLMSTSYFSDRSVENLCFLSSRRAIEDIATFIQGMKDEFNLGVAAWITFRGSYSGALTLWAREKHPELIAGAVGSSPPIRLEHNIIRSEHLQVVDNSLHLYSNECVENVRKGFQSMASLMNLIISRLDPPFANLSLTYNDIQNFYTTIYGNFQAAVQNSGYNAVSKSVVEQ